MHWRRPILATVVGLGLTGLLAATAYAPVVNWTQEPIAAMLPESAPDTNVDHAFRQVLKHCGLRGGKGCPGPRLHHLRHSYACTRLLLWYREGKDINALLPALATYLGHVNISSTQVYLRATTELLEQANQRFAAHFRHNILTHGD